VTNGGLGRASQPLALQRFSLGLIEATVSGQRQPQPEVRRRSGLGVRQESLPCDADCLTHPHARFRVDVVRPRSACVTQGCRRRRRVRREHPVVRQARPRADETVEVTGEEDCLATGLPRCRRSDPSAPSRAAATAWRAGSIAAAASPRSSIFARMGATTASKRGDTHTAYHLRLWVFTSVALAWWGGSES
jgi:hypothetical protein